MLATERRAPNPHASTQRSDLDRMRASTEKHRELVTPPSVRHLGDLSR